MVAAAAAAAVIRMEWRCFKLTRRTIILKRLRTHASIGSL